MRRLLMFLACVILTACTDRAIQPTQLATVTPCPSANTSVSTGICNPHPGYTTPLSSQPAAGPPNASPTPEGKPTLRVTPSPTLPNPTAPTLSSSLIFARPIAPPGNNQSDTTYRFGSTQGKKRDPHHGVEFLNPQSTPVLAAADGVVVVAGDDKKTLYGPYYNYYGNLVVIQHDLRSKALQDGRAFPTPVYTLYAHLSEVLVKPGQKVRQGQEIGKVGMTGGATGSHLHFEVRLGENTYAASRNPELWLMPLQDDSGQPKGAIAGRVIDSRGLPVAVKGVVIQHLVNGPGSHSDWEVYLDSYEEKALLGSVPWQESFAAGGLPAGWYRVNFPHGGLQRQEVQVLPGQVTVVEFQVR
jgi:murein DD-endopeptidase MepM/ murein hydrolase activator NlpD